MANRRELLQATMASGIAAALPWKSASANPVAGSSPWHLAETIVARITPPQFAERFFILSSFGAVGDGKTDCTKAFAHAIAACSESGGGIVVVPPGDWLSGAIQLKSNVNLHLKKDAVIRFSTDPSAYLPLVLTRWEGIELMSYSPLIYAFEQENIAITGEGTLEGQADNSHWWQWCGARQFGWHEGMPSQHEARKKLAEMAEAGVPVEQRIFGEGSYLRPVFIEPYRCKNILIDGVTIRNAPFWEIHPVLCTNVTVSNLTINSAGPNTDGCDPESSKDVLIDNCSFNTGDDCIAIKSGRNADGRRLNVPSENIVIRNCHMKNGHGGITIGSEITGGVRYVFAENCRMDSPHLGSALRIKNNAMRGGLLEHFYFRHIAIGKVAHAVLTIDCNYEEGPHGPFKPVVRDVRIETTASGESQYGVDIQGLASAPVSNIALYDCDFRNVAAGNIVKNVSGILSRNVKVNGKLFKPPR
jgi:polygalacturonase